MGGLAVASGIVDAGGLVDGDEAERWVTIRSSRSWAVFGIYQVRDACRLGTQDQATRAVRGTRDVAGSSFATGLSFDRTRYLRLKPPFAPNAAPLRCSRSHVSDSLRHRSFPAVMRISQVELALSAALCALCLCSTAPFLVPAASPRTTTCGGAARRLGAARRRAGATPRIMTGRQRALCTFLDVSPL